MSADAWLGVLALALGIALIAFNRRIGGWTVAPQWRPGSRGARFEEAYQRRYPWSRRLYSQKGRLTLARFQAVLCGGVFALLGIASLLDWL